MQENQCIGTRGLEMTVAFGDVDVIADTHDELLLSSKP